jgi:bifunctional UDP-N-acetylglucosamine pyrophosphorylase/glucosamine-1-phosphate N-acetyltransferase
MQYRIYLFIIANRSYNPSHDVYCNYPRCRQRHKNALKPAKPLHRLAGKPLIEWVLDSTIAAEAKHAVMVVGADDSQVSDHINQINPGTACQLDTVVQDPPLGTGHAVEAATEKLKSENGIAVIAFADTPLISADTFHALVHAISNDGHDICCLGFEAANPTGYGRLIRDQNGSVSAIIEEKEADANTRAITLCNSGLMAVKMPLLFDLLAAIGFNEQTGEKFLTDIIGEAHHKGHSIGCVMAQEDSVMGINNRVDLARAERIIQQRLRHKAMMEGVTLIDPDSVYLNADAVIAQDVIIHPHVVIGGGVRIGEGAEIKSFSHIEGADIGACAGDWALCPFAARDGSRRRRENWQFCRNQKCHHGCNG